MENDTLGRRDFLKSVGLSPLIILLTPKTLGSFLEDSSKPSKKYDVFDLYGGKEAVLERVDKLIRSKLREKPSNFKKMILEDLMKSSAPTCGEVIGYLNGKIKVNRDIFSVFKPYLRLRLGDALGKPCFASEEIRNYWITEKKNKPMRMVVAEPLLKNPFEGEKGLELYVDLRAIGEFYKAA